MAGARCIAPRPQIDAPGDRGVVPNGAGWPHTLLSGAPSRQSSHGSGRLSRSQAGFDTHFLANPEMQVSPETIYRSLFIQSRGVLKRALLRQLRRQRHFRHARGSARIRPRQGQILDAVSIRQRPADVADRALPGHWEGDLLEGARGTYIVTLVERQSRYVMLVRLPNKETQTVIRALARRIRRLPHGLMKSLTWDRGSELAAHRAFTIATNIQVYFVIRKVRGSAAPTKTPMDYCASTCPTRSTSPATAKRDSD